MRDGTSEAASGKAASKGTERRLSLLLESRSTTAGATLRELGGTSSDSSRGGAGASLLVCVHCWRIKEIEAHLRSRTESAGLKNRTHPAFSNEKLQVCASDCV